MEKLIQNLIDFLDFDSDALLIGLLEIKLGKLHADYNKKFSISDNEIKAAKRGLDRSLTTIQRDLLNSHDRYARLSKISEVKNCNSCVFGEEEIYITWDGNKKITKYPSDNSYECNICKTRDRRIYKEMEKFENNMDKSVGEILSNDVIITKCILNKLRRKISELTFK